MRTETPLQMIALLLAAPVDPSDGPPSAGHVSMNEHFVLCQWFAHVQEGNALSEIGQGRVRDILARVFDMCIVAAPLEVSLRRILQ